MKGPKESYGNKGADLGKLREKLRGNLWPFGCRKLRKTYQIERFAVKLCFLLDKIPLIFLSKMYVREQVTSLEQIKKIIVPFSIHEFR